MTHLNPFIRFNDSKCKEAMNFYKSCLGGELSFMTVKGSPMEKDMPTEKGDLIMHSTLKKDGWYLIGSDMMRDVAKVGDNVGVSVDFDNENEIKEVAKKLAEGGETFMEVQEVFW